MARSERRAGDAIPPPPAAPPAGPRPPLQPHQRNPRIACLLVPDFAAAAQIRVEGDLALLPFAVTGGGERERVLHVSRQARAAGVAPGMTRAAALAVLKSLRLVPQRPELLAQARADLVTALQTVSPAVEPAEPEASGLFLLDPRGLALVHRDEDELLGRMLDAARRTGFPGGFAAAADSRFTAAAAARAAACGLVPAPARRIRVAPGGAAAFLAPLPLALLPLEERTRARIADLGLFTLGAFAALPAPAVEVRYGRDGVLAHGLARGAPDGLFARAPEHETVEETVALEERIADRARLRPLLEMLLDRLLRRVSRDGARGVLALLALFRLDDGRDAETLVEPASPSADMKALLGLCDLALDRTRFSAPVVAATLRVLAQAPREKEQGRLFARRRVDSGRLRRALDRLRLVLGAGALQRITLRPSHLPEARSVAADFMLPPARAARAARAGSASDAGDAGAAAPPRGSGVCATLCLVDPPRPLMVRLDGGRIAAFALAASFSPGASMKQVRLRFGPHRVSGAWWERPFDRDYFQVATADQGLYWLFQDRASGRFYLHGVYD